MKTINFTTKINSMINAGKSVSELGRAMFDDVHVEGFEDVTSDIPTTDQKAEIIRSILQAKVDSGKIENKQVRSINSGMRRETRKYSAELLDAAGIEDLPTAVGFTLDKDTGQVTANIGKVQPPVKDPISEAIKAFKASVKDQDTDPVVAEYMGKVVMAMNDYHEKAKVMVERDQELSDATPEHKPTPLSNVA